MKLTRAGQKALAKSLAESFELHFTKFATGSGDFDYETERVYDLTELKHWEMDLPITELKVIGDGTAEISAYLSNAEVVKGFPCKEHGLYCLDENGDEFLFSYRNVGNDYDFIPSFTGSAVKNIFLTEEVEIRDAENITAQIDLSVAYVNTEDFKEHVESAHPHLNTPNHYDDVQTTAEIWATDNDNHLHKISIDNLKNILREDTVAEKVDAAAELGLNANLLFVEDFTENTILDTSTTLVTSCAEHGNLLGVADFKNLQTGARYVISDGTAAEFVDIQSLRKNQSGLYALLKNPLANSYKNPRLYRTAPDICDTQKITWQSDKFEGVHANLIRELPLLFESKDIRGDGFINSDNFFTLG